MLYETKGVMLKAFFLYTLIFIYRRIFCNEEIGAQSLCLLCTGVKFRDFTPKLINLPKGYGLFWSPPTKKTPTHKNKLIELSIGNEF